MLVDIFKGGISLDYPKIINFMYSNYFRLQLNHFLLLFKHIHYCLPPNHLGLSRGLTIIHLSGSHTNHFPSDLVNRPFTRSDQMVRPSFFCFESPTVLFASQHNLFRTMWQDRICHISQILFATQFRPCDDSFWGLNCVLCRTQLTVWEYVETS